MLQQAQSQFAAMACPAPSEVAGMARAIKELAVSTLSLYSLSLPHMKGSPRDLPLIAGKEQGLVCSSESVSSRRAGEQRAGPLRMTS